MAIAHAALNKTTQGVSRDCQIKQIRADTNCHAGKRRVRQQRQSQRKLTLHRAGDIGRAEADLTHITEERSVEGRQGIVQTTRKDDIDLRCTVSAVLGIDRNVGTMHRERSRRTGMHLGHQTRRVEPPDPFDTGDRWHVRHIGNLRIDDTKQTDHRIGAQILTGPVHHVEIETYAHLRDAADTHSLDHPAASIRRDRSGPIAVYAIDRDVGEAYFCLGVRRRPIARECPVHANMRVTKIDQQPIECQRAQRTVELTAGAQTDDRLESRGRNWQRQSETPRATRKIEDNIAKFPIHAYDEIHVARQR